jgi:hypothetical protein
LVSKSIIAQYKKLTNSSWYLNPQNSTIQVGIQILYCRVDQAQVGTQNHKNQKIQVGIQIHLQSRNSRTQQVAVQIHLKLQIRNSKNSSWYPNPFFSCGVKTPELKFVSKSHFAAE